MTTTPDAAAAQLGAHSDPDRSVALELDAADPLARFADRYVPMDPDVVAYLDGNSLGRPLAAIGTAWSQLAGRTWPGRLIRGWTEGWMELPGTVGDELARACLGAAAGQTVIADSTTVNFYKCLRAALNLRPGRRRLIVDRDNFPTNRFIGESLARDLGLELVWLTGDPIRGIGLDRITAALDADTAAVTLSHTAYRSAQVADMAGVTAAAHRAGAVVLWDLSHSVGVYPVELDACAVDFAVGCTYKFVGAGPGAPAFAYVNREHHGALDQPIWGWLGRADPFEMEQGYRPAPGITSMISGTPSIPGLLAVREGAAVIAEAGIDAIRAKAVALGEYAIDCYEKMLRPLGFGLGSPRDATVRGGHISITRADARELCQSLIAAGVIPDFRTPDIIRLGLSPLTTSYAQVYDAMTVLRVLSC